jgi:hypothetical protein
LEALTRYVEGPDLPTTRAFDGSGHVIRLTSEPIKRRFGLVSVPPVSGTVTSDARREELREVLRSYLADRAGLPDDGLGDLAIEELLERALSMAGYMR